MRQAAVILKKFASSIAPHITTILVHGKQVIFRQSCTQDSACFTASKLVSQLTVQFKNCMRVRQPRFGIIQNQVRLLKSQKEYVFFKLIKHFCFFFHFSSSEVIRNKQKVAGPISITDSAQGISRSFSVLELKYRLEFAFC